MSNRYIKKLAVYDVKAGTEISHDLYGTGKIVSIYPYDGIADIQFSDGHMEYGFDITAQIKPTSVLDIEAFKCPITNEEVLAERCACAKDGIYACDYFKTDLEKKESSCIYESEMQRIASEEKDKIKREAKVSKEKLDAVNEIKKLLNKLLKEAKFEDVLGPAPEGITAKNESLYVQHRVTGAKGKVEKSVSDNAVVVNWKTQEEAKCPCSTVVTGDEIVPDNEAKLWCKIKETQEKLKKKFVKPINDFFKKKKASVESDLIKIDADKIIEKMAKLPEERKLVYLSEIKAHLNKLGFDVEPSSIVLDQNGVAKFYDIVKIATNDIIPEYESKLDSKNISASLGYEGDVLKIYATIKGQLSDNFKKAEEIPNINVSNADLKTLF